MFRDGSRWDPALFAAALSIGTAQAPERRALLNLGDLISAIAELPPAVDGAPWIFDGAVDPHAFDALGYAAASRGIAETQRANRQGWWAHAEHHRSFILNAALRAPRTDVAAVFGAGKAFDLPLADLARRFGRVILVDIDAKALEETSVAAVRDPALRGRLELRSMDLSGVGARLARGIENAIASAGDAAAAEMSLAALCHSYRLSAAPPLLGTGERADLVVSGLMLSQLALQAKLLAKHLFEARFGAIPQEMKSRWSLTWNELDLRVQQDHINALADQAELAVVTSDVRHDSTWIDARGGEQLRRDPWLVLGTPMLEERIPRFLEVLARATWTWRRIQAKPPTHDGVITNVDAVLIRPAANSEHSQSIAKQPDTILSHESR